MSRQRWDAIVIGAGLGGMLAATILARRGRRVLLLEQEHAVGGRLRSYDVDGFVVDTGAFLWPNLYLDAALSAAGVTQFRSSVIPPTQVMRLFVQGCGGQRFSFPWPGRGESPAMLAAASAALLADAETFRGMARLWEELAALSDDAVAGLRHTPMRDALPRFTSDTAVAAAFRRNVMLFGTYDPDSASMGECIGLRRRRLDLAPPKPECPGDNPGGGVRALPLAIRQALDAAGVELRVGWTVNQITIEAGRATGVAAHGATPFQEHFDAAAVISNVPIWQFFNLAPAEHFSASLVRSASGFRTVGGTVNAAFAFKRLPRLRATGTVDDFPGWTRLLMTPAREFGGGMLWTTLHSPHNAPDGQHVLQAMRLSPHADIAAAHRVRQIIQAFHALLEEMYLDVRETLLWSRSWVTRDGSEYMISAAPKPPVQAEGIAGLYFVGETTNVPAVQMDAAALSALRCADLICPV